MRKPKPKAEALDPVITAACEGCAFRRQYPKQETLFSRRHALILKTSPRALFMQSLRDHIRDNDGHTVAIEERRRWVMK